MFGRFPPKVKTGALIAPEDGKILVSVPSAVHSHKPPLHGAYHTFTLHTETNVQLCLSSDLLLPYVEKKPKILELFARSLMQDTTSCGYEVLKLQHDFLFQQVEPKGKRLFFI
jgi:N(6)-adenine-specific DNA methyltransferase